MYLKMKWVLKITLNNIFLNPLRAHYCMDGEYFMASPVSIIRNNHKSYNSF